MMQFQNTVVQELNDGNFCVAIGIDIKNTFNSIKWPDILSALKRWDVPPYLYNFTLIFRLNRARCLAATHRGETLMSK